tara:strand:- start:156 stop:743 length:588 start_codon:yes stop_codon:yes gene_type:complete
MRSSKSRSRSNKNRNRSVGNIINRVFDSSGPEGKVRGTPQQIIDKYNQLARDSQLSNDRVSTENFQQHAEHYVRLLSEAQREMDTRREQQDRENKDRNTDRDKERNSRTSLDNDASDQLNETDLNGNNSSVEAEFDGHLSDGERISELDNVNQDYKKNRNGNSRNNKARRSGQTNNNDDKVDKIGDDISSVEAAE